MSVSGLMENPNASGAMAMHQPHQLKDASGGDRFIQVYSFSDPAFGRNNRVEIPAVDMVVDKMLVEINATLGGTASAAYMKGSFLVNNYGVQLQAKNNTVYTASEALLDQYNNQMAQNENLLLDLKLASNDLAVAYRRNQYTAGVPCYIDLQPIVDSILGKAGAIGAYPSFYWAVDVGLKAAASCIDGSDGVAGTASISSMNLILIGHREDKENVQRQTAALAENGISIAYSYPSSIRNSYAAAATSLTVSLPQIQGQMSGIWVLTRVKAGIDAVLGNAVANSYKLYNANGDSVAVGTTGNPTLLWGRALSQNLIRQSFHGNSSMGGSASLVPATATTLALEQSSLLNIPISEKEWADLQFGMYSGSMRVNNDLLITFAFTTTVTADYVDVIVFVRKVATFGLSGLLANVNEE